MKKERGFIHIVAAVTIALVALGMVGAAYYLIKYKADDIAPTNSATHATANTNTANFNANQNVNTTTNENANVATATNENVNSDTTNTNASASTACPWHTYTNAEYGYTVQYPCDWTEEYEEVTTDETFTEFPIRYLKFYSPDNQYRLMVGLMLPGDDGGILGRTGIGAGEVKSGETITIEGESVQLANLVYEGQVNEVFGDDPTVAGTTEIKGFVFQSYFSCSTDLEFADYTACEANNLVDQPEYETAKEILETIDLP